MDRQTGDGLPPVPSGAIRPQDGEPPRRAGGEISVFLGYLFCALGGLAATASPLAAALFVGDSDVDMQTAHNAGMRSAGAVWGFRGEEELRRAGAGILLRKPVEIVNCC